MLMDFDIHHTGRIEDFVVPAFDAFSLLLPLAGSGGYGVKIASHQKHWIDRAYLHGQLSEPILNSFRSEQFDNGSFALFGIIFTPVGLQHFVRRGLGAMNIVQNTFISAENILPNVALLQEELQELYHQERYSQNYRLDNPQRGSTALQRMGVLIQKAENFLLTMLRNMETAESLRQMRGVEQAAIICKRLTATRGKVSIEAIAKELDISERHVRRIMQEYIGVSGKTFGEIQRFMYAAQLLVSTAVSTPADTLFTSESLHSVIHQAGYYDQSHCIRDFKRFAGCTPLQFLAQRHPLGEKIIGA
jgi:AraC-like DNA-binding protein